MTIHVLINGAFGKMGQMAVKTINDHTDFTLVGEIGRAHDLLAEIHRTKAEVVIDFTEANAALKNTQTIIEAKARPVIGTSGLTKKDVINLEKRAEKLKLGGIIAPNFSLGAVLMMKYAKEIAAYFPHVEIIEMHHDGKLDSPSSTALRTAEMLATTRDVTYLTRKNSKEVVPGARGAYYQNVPIHAIRLPGLVAHQKIIFGGIGETLTLQHDAVDRACFMPGLVLACKKVMTLDHLVYGLDQILV
ncbi:MAG: dihydrodipicolinate reductase [uncultured bacterium]|nr:MAG: dihydrodipicolinate reductase [uncultured bacterium]